MTPEERAEHLLRPIEMSEAETKVRKWLADFQHILTGHSIDAILFFAKLNDLDEAATMSVLSSFDLAMSGRHPESAARLNMFHFEQTVERVAKMRADLESPKKLDLIPLWQELRANTVTGEPVELKELI